MFTKKLSSLVIMIVIALSSLQAQAAGDWFDYLRIGMNYAGFSQGVTRNVIADGWTYDFYQDINREYDFGNCEMNVSGVLSGQMVISNRGIPEVEFNITTPSGLFYDYLATDGPNEVLVEDGFFYIQQKIIINRGGGYHIDYRLLNEGTLIYCDEYDEDILDYDIGPIAINGNIYIDFINLTLGEWFDFTLPGGGLDDIIAGWEQITDAQAEGTAKVASYDSYSPEGFAVASVPEPISLMILICGAGMIVGRRK